MSKIFRTPYDLPTRFEGESGSHIENEFLFGVYEYIFTNRKPIEFSHPLNQYFFRAGFENFPNHIEDSVAEKKLSHDQVTAYMCYNELFHLGQYDAIYDSAKKQKALTHPRDYLYYKLLDKSLIGFLGLPIIYLLALISFFIPYRLTKDKIDRPDQVLRIGNYIIRKKLSGELLYVLKVHGVKHDTILKLSMLPVKYIIKLGAFLRYGDTEKMVKEYFQNKSEHPIVFNYNLEF